MATFNQYDRAEVERIVRDMFQTGQVGSTVGSVTLSGVQTLSNKTLDSPVLNNPTGLTPASVGLSWVPTSDPGYQTAAQVSTSLSSKLNTSAFTSFQATLGTMSTQNASAVSITGGTIAGTTTFSGSGGINIATNKFLVEGSTGNTAIGNALLTSTLPFLRVGYSGVFQGNATDNQIIWLNNGYNAGVVEKYINNGPASRLFQHIDGSLIFQTAPSGIANNSPTYTTRLTIITDGTTTYTNTLLAKHFKGNTSAPTIAAGVGMGTSPTGVSVTGNDSMFKIAFTTGTTPVTGIIATITFNQAFSTNPPAIVLVGTNDGAVVNGSLWRIGTITTTTVTIINTATNTLPASTAYTITAKTEEQ